MVMESAPSAPFEVAKPEFLLELLIVALDAPAQFGDVDQTAEGNIWREGREPVFGRLILALWPLDQQPFLRSALGELVITMRDPNADASKARGQPLGGAFPPLDRAPGALGETAWADRERVA